MLLPSHFKANSNVISNNGIDIYRSSRLSFNIHFRLTFLFHQLTPETAKHIVITLIQPTHQVAAIVDESSTQCRNPIFRTGHSRLISLIITSQLLQAGPGSISVICGICCSLLCSSELDLRISSFDISSEYCLIVKTLQFLYFLCPDKDFSLDNFFSSYCFLCSLPPNITLFQRYSGLRQLLC